MPDTSFDVLQVAVGETRGGNTAPAGGGRAPLVRDDQSGLSSPEERQLAVVAFGPSLAAKRMYGYRDPLSSKLTNHVGGHAEVAAGERRTLLRLDELVRLVSPHETSLMLGAGASVSSGAPTGAQLAKYLASKLPLPPEGDDLAEICGIFENRRGRKELVSVLREKLIDLQPTQGMLALPSFNWHAIYTTNFDRLVERSYASAGSSAVPAERALLLVERSGPGVRSDAHPPH